MSYDVRLMIDTGNGEVPVTDNLNYTYNVYPMLRLAFDEPESGIYCLEGSTGAEYLGGLRSALKDLEEHAEKYLHLNPANGWGSHAGLVRWLREVLSNCEQHPLATLRIT